MARRSHRLLAGALGALVVLLLGARAQVHPWAYMFACARARWWATGPYTTPTNCICVQVDYLTSIPHTRLVRAFMRPRACVYTWIAPSFTRIHVPQAAGGGVEELAAASAEAAFGVVQRRHLGLLLAFGF